MISHRQTLVGSFIFRWLVSSLGLWVAAGLFGGISYDSSRAIIISGFILALINMVVKPIVVIFSLPALIFTLGLFMIVINGLMVMIASKLYTPLHITSFWTAMLAGMVIGLVNYLVVTVLEDKGAR